MFNIMRRIFRCFVGLSNRNRSLNVYKTLMFNFRAFGLKGLLKLPVYIYSNTNIYRIGKIIIDCPWERGLVRIGFLDFKSQGITKFSNQGVIRVMGPVEVGGCSIIDNCGEILFGGSCRIADGCQVYIKTRLDFGENSRLGFHSVVMDSDDHFSFDVESRKVPRFSKPISIGKYNWIGCGSFIKKGTKTPDYMIVASANALLCKNYMDFPPYSVVGGAPIRLIKTGIRRIFNNEHENEILNFFMSNPSADCYEIDKEIDLDQYCAQK